MNIGPAELLTVLFLVGYLGVPIWGIIDAAVRPESQWSEADQSKVLWIVLQVIGGIVAAIAYFVAIRPKLKAVEARPAPIG